MNGLTTTASREASPLSAMVTSQESSPSAFFNSSPSPGTGIEFVSGTMLGGGPQNAQWVPPPNNFQNNGFPAMLQGPVQHQMPRIPPQIYPMGVPYKPTLTIHPTPMKSRVETQIPIKLTIFPLPLGITKLHLPTHTISKPKLLAPYSSHRC